MGSAATPGDHVASEILNARSQVPGPAGPTTIAEENVQTRLERARDVLRQANTILDEMTGTPTSGEVEKAPIVEGIVPLSNDLAVLSEGLRDRLASLRLTLGRL